MPASASITWTNQKLEPFRDPGDARTRAVAFKHSVQNLAKGTVMAQVSSTGLWAAYASGAGDGTEVARGLLVYDIQVDASGNVSFSSTSAQSGDEFGTKFLDAPIYVAGCFRTTDLVGLDAGAITDLGGWLEAGTIADGVFRF
jgi:hypothetical protein